MTVFASKLTLMSLGPPPAPALSLVPVLPNKRTYIH